MTTETFQLDTTRVAGGPDYLAGIRRARQAGKKMMPMLWEMAKLRLGPGKLSPEEYFLYELYDDNRYSAEVKRTFVTEDGLAQAGAWADIAADKPTLTTLLKGMGLPIPETQAILHPYRTFPGAESLRNERDLVDFLRSAARYPIFAKPFDGACSLGAVAIMGHDSETDFLSVAGEQSVRVDRLVSQIVALERPYLLQTLLLPHPKITAIIGPHVSSVRMFVMADGDDVNLWRAAWKIPAPDSRADNFWRSGNMLAGIDCESGQIGKVIQRTDSGTEAIQRHPVTDAEFAQMKFPQWDAMRDTVMAAAINLPGCPFQGWDVALTDRGPVLVELEGDGGNPVMEQMCFESGLLQGRYLELIDKQRQQIRQRARSTKRHQRRGLRQGIDTLGQMGSMRTPK